MRFIAFTGKQLPLIALLFCFNNTIQAGIAPSPTPVSGPSLNEKTYSKYEDISELRQKIVWFAETYKGTPYVYAGRSAKGFDCSGFTSYVMKNFDVLISPSSRTQATQGKMVELKSARPGDLVFFSHNRSTIGHVAMVVENTGDKLFIVHSTNSRGVVMENVYQSAYWMKRIRFARNVLGE